MLNKYKHICVICRQTGALATDIVPNRTEYSIASCWYSQQVASMSSQIGKIVLISFPSQQWTLMTYSSVAYLNTLPAGLCFKPLEYILITIFKENNVCCLCDTISLHCFRDQIYFKYMAWVGCISVAIHNWSYEPSSNENCQIEKQRNC